MKEINQLVHQTGSLENLKSILKNGLYSSYALEQFTDKKLLIPMISFSNIQFRDIGKKEVVDYGSYGIAIEREVGIEYKLNPVTYLYESNQIERAIHENFNFSIIPQALSKIKEFYQGCNCNEVTKRITINPLPFEVKNLINSIGKNTSDQLINSIQELFTKIFKNSYRQILLAKPYKVQNQKGDTFIAYNEREWRKSFFDLDFIYKHTPKGELNPKFKDWITIPKPHLTNPEHTLLIPLEKIKYIIVEKTIEIAEIRQYIEEIYGATPNSLKIDTLESLKEKEIVN